VFFQLSFIYCHLNFHANLIRPWTFPLKLVILHGIFGCYIYIENFAVTSLEKNTVVVTSLHEKLFDLQAIRTS
jgi:hypothetical protein